MRNSTLIREITEAAVKNNWDGYFLPHLNWKEGYDEFYCYLSAEKKITAWRFNPNFMRIEAWRPHALSDNEKQWLESQFVFLFPEWEVKLMNTTSDGLKTFAWVRKGTKGVA